MSGVCTLGCCVFNWADWEVHIPSTRAGDDPLACQSASCGALGSGTIFFTLLSRVGPVISSHERLVYARAEVSGVELSSSLQLPAIRQPYRTS
jgi:hypothetical protein